MKKVYSTPVFTVEEYSFNDSIAACEMHYGDPDSNTPITINEGDSLCPVGDKGHAAGGGTIKVFPVTIFGDNCSFNWNGTKESFGKAFYGATAGNPNHYPAINGKTFWS